MIYLDKGELNTFALTLTENSTIQSPTWLFEFENEFNTALQPIYWVGIDTSPYVNRYNLFTLEEGVAIGSLSLVNKSIPEYTIAVGNPAKALKERKKDLKQLEWKYLSQSK